MRNQEFVAALSLFRLNMRKLGILYFVPIVVLFVLLPFLAYGQIIARGGNSAINDIFTDFQQFVPFMGCWWILFGLSDYVEGKTSELLQTYKKSVLWDFVILFVWYTLHVTVLFAGFGFLVDNYWKDFVLIIMQSALFASVGFFLLFLTKTMLVPFLVALFYEIFAMLTYLDILRYVNIFSPARIEHFSQLLLPYLPLLLASVLFVIAGNLLYKRRKP